MSTKANKRKTHIDQFLCIYSVKSSCFLAKIVSKIFLDNFPPLLTLSLIFYLTFLCVRVPPPLQRRSSCCLRLHCWYRSAVFSRCLTAPTLEVSPAFSHSIFCPLIASADLCVSGSCFTSTCFVICFVLSVVLRCARTCHQAAAAVSDSYQGAGEI